MQTVQGMHAVPLSHHIENESITTQVPDSIRDRRINKRERQLPKLNVAGSIPVSRSIKSTTYRIGRNRELHLNSIKRILQHVYGSLAL